MCNYLSINTNKEEKKKNVVHMYIISWYIREILFFLFFSGYFSLSQSTFQYYNTTPLVCGQSLYNIVITPIHKRWIDTSPVSVNPMVWLVTCQFVSRDNLRHFDFSFTFTLCLYYTYVHTHETSYIHVKFACTPSSYILAINTSTSYS